VIENGGSVIYGWALLVDSKGLYVAQHHAIWLTHDGNYLDVTPDNKVSTVSWFLPDNRVPNHYKDMVGTALLYWKPDPSMKPTWAIENPEYFSDNFKWLRRTPAIG
jgi:hypothetical protein